MSEEPGAIRRFHRARSEARMSGASRVRVAHRADDRNTSQALDPAAQAEDAGGGLHVGRATRGTPKKLNSSRIPIRGPQIEQLRARGIGHIARMKQSPVSASRSANYRLCRSRYRLRSPGRASREHSPATTASYLRRRADQSRARYVLATSALMPSAAQLVADGRGATALPEYRGSDGTDHSHGAMQLPSRAGWR